MIRRALVIIVALSAVSVGACTGVPTDAEPNPISRDALPSPLLPSTSSTSTVPANAEPSYVFLVRTDENGKDVLEERIVYLPDDSAVSTPRTILTHLITNEPTAEHSDAGLKSDIPPNLRLLSIERDGERATVDVSSLGDIESQKLLNAIAQMVFTLTAIEGTNEVVIKVDGSTRELQVEAGVKPAGEAITRDDFPAFAARLQSAASDSTTTLRRIDPPQ